MFCFTGLLNVIAKTGAFHFKLLSLNFIGSVFSLLHNISASTDYSGTCFVMIAVSLNAASPVWIPFFLYTKV